MSVPAKKKSLLPRSLEGRYLLVATLFIAIIVIAAWWASHHAHRAQDQASAQLLIKNQSSQIIQDIRFSLWESNQALQEFMVTPSISQKEQIDSAMHSAQMHVSFLYALFDTEHAEWKKLTRIIDNRMDRLQTVLNKLAMIRQNHALLHPASTTMNEVMLPMNTNFHTAVTLALSQLEQPQTRDELMLYNELDGIKDNWITMIGAFRVFVANRFGAFNNAGMSLSGQQQNIELFYRQINNSLNKLNTQKDDGDLDLQVETSITVMQQTAKKWFMAYKVVAESYNNEEWRTDTPYLRNVVQPEFESLWDVLAELELSVESSSSKEVAVYGNLANRVTNILWLFSVLALVLIVLGYLSLRRIVISPLTNLSSALSDEASGKRHNKLLPDIDVVEIKGLIHAFSNMSDKVHERTTDLQHKAHFDNMTGLPNRLMMENKLRETLHDATQSSTQVGIMVIDFDGFKNINDQFGHHTGDEFLRIIGQRFMFATRKNEMVARIGGDEFGVILPDSSREDAIHIAHRLEEQICKPCTIQNITIPVSMSIGISLFPYHGLDVEQLLRHADDAMYQAKRGKEGVALYNPKVVPLVS